MPGAKKATHILDLNLIIVVIMKVWKKWIFLPLGLNVVTPIKTVK